MRPKAMQRGKNLAITLGDPAGIGPEVTYKALLAWMQLRLKSQHQAPLQPIQVILLGPENILAPWHWDKALCQKANLEIIAHPLPAFTGPSAKPSAASGQAAIEALNAAISKAQAGQIDALVTAPISKEACAMAGGNFCGHTELLAQTLGAGPVAMSFWSPKLCAALVTDHIPLLEVPKAISKQRIIDVASLLHKALKRQNPSGGPPKILVAGLNPHAGEAGLLGCEDENQITPAVRHLVASGIDAIGPLPGDSIWQRAQIFPKSPKAQEEGPLGVVAMYHDQALAPIKALCFGEAVNMTLGLKIPRTSPDHGTAFDLAGLGVASPLGMQAALVAAEQQLNSASLPSEFSS